MFPEHNVFCTSVKCAAMLGALGARPKKEDFITVEKIPGGENVQYRWEPVTQFGENVADLISAYNVMSRGGQPPINVIKILNDAAHRIHICFNVFKHRDRLHNRIKSGNFDLPPPVGYVTKDIKLASSLASLCGQEKSAFRQGKEVFFAFESSDELMKLATAYKMAWNELTLPIDSPIYYCKAVLNKRDEFIHLKEDQADKVAMVKIQDGNRTLFARAKTPPELIKRALQY